MNATGWSWWILLSCACWVFIRRYRTMWYDVCLVLACAVIFASCPAHCLVGAHIFVRCQNFTRLRDVQTSCHWPQFGPAQVMLENIKVGDAAMPPRKGNGKWDWKQTGDSDSVSVKGESIQGIPFLGGKYTWFRHIIDLFDRTALVTNPSLELIQLQALEGPETCAIARRVGGWWRWG